MKADDDRDHREKYQTSKINSRLTLSSRDEKHSQDGRLRLRVVTKNNPFERWTKIDNKGSITYLLYERQLQALKGRIDIDQL